MPGSSAATEGEGGRHLVGAEEEPQGSCVICKQSRKQNLEREELL